MLCAIYNKKEKLKIVEQSVPKIGNDEVLLKVDVCGVCGSDLAKIKSDLVPEGTVLGHEVVGTIVETGSQVRMWSTNQKVVVAHHVPCLSCYFCKSSNFSMCTQFKNTNLLPGGFSEYLKISKVHLEHTTFLIPKGTVSDYEIALTEPLACCLRAVNRANVKTSNSVLISGLGSVGIMLSKLCIQKGANTIGADILPERIAFAKKSLVVHHAFRADNDELKKGIMEQTEGRGVDILFLASGSSKSVQEATKLVRSGGKILVFSGTSEKETFCNNEIYYRELTVLGSYSPSPISLKEAYQMIITGRIKLKDLITDVIQLNDLPKEIEKCFSNRSIKMMVENQ